MARTMQIIRIGSGWSVFPSQGKTGGGVMEEIRCEVVRKKLADYREHRLGPPEKGQIERHLFYCPDCIFHLALVTAKSLEREKEEVPAGS
jgi:hypothetical protein